MFYHISRYLTDKYFDIVWGCHHPGDPPNGPPNINFLNGSTWVPVCFDISRYLTDKYFDIVWGCHPPGDPPKWTPPKINFLNGSTWVPVCFDISRYLTDEYFDIVWGCHPPGNLPPNEARFGRRYQVAFRRFEKIAFEILKLSNNLCGQV